MILPSALDLSSERATLQTDDSEVCSLAHDPQPDRDDVVAPYHHSLRFCLGRCRSAVNLASRAGRVGMSDARRGQISAGAAETKATLWRAPVLQEFASSQAHHGWVCRQTADCQW